MAPEARGFPLGPEAITPEWLTDALRAGGLLGSDGSVAHLRVESLGIGKGFAGRLAQVAIEYLGEPGNAPPTLVAKFPSSLGPTRKLAERFGLYEREVSFYRLLSDRSGVATPLMYYGDVSDAGDVVLLLEQITGRSGEMLAGCTLDEAALVVEAIAAMHVAWWDSPELEGIDWLPAPNARDALELGDEIAGPAWKAFLKKAGHHLPAKLISLGNRTNGDQSTLHRLSAAPRTLVHGDLNAANVMFSVDGKRVEAVVDWQTVIQGRGPIDIAHFFVSSLQPEDRKVAEAELLPRYHDQLARNGVSGYSLKECWDDYRLAVMNQVGQIVAISYLLDITEQLGDGVEAATGVRPLVALLELDVSDLVRPESRIERFWSRLRRPIRRSA